MKLMAVSSMLAGGWRPITGFVSLILVLHTFAFTQQVQWATKVLEVSSEYRDPKNPGPLSAKQALGPPSVNPLVSEGIECAWMPSEANSAREEYIKLGYAQAIHVQQIAISEALGASSVIKVILFDPKNTPKVVYTNTSPKKATKPGRMLNIFIPPTEYLCKSVMVVLNTNAVDGYNQIDAVGISESTDTIKPEIHLAEGELTAFSREHLGPEVNSEAEELLPVITPDGLKLYFARQGHPDNQNDPDNQNVWVSEWSPDGFWAEATRLGSPLNNGENNAVTSITPDGQTLMMLNKYGEDGSTDNGVSLARRNGNDWGKPIGQEIDNFYLLSEFAEFALSASGKIIVMTVQREDSRGGKDLYVSFLKPDGHWTAPKSLGPTVNTAASEVGPFLAADECTLYFGTTGRVGYGSMDTYVTRRLDTTWTNWTEPANLGPVLNSSAWDGYYSIPAAGDYAYFVSYANAAGKADIFRSKLPESARPKPVVLVKGHVLNALTREPISASILYESLSSGNELGIARSDQRDGTYSIILPSGDDYGFLAEAKGFVPVSENIDLQELASYQEITRDLLLVPLETGNVVRLNNLFFDSGKADLRAQSTKELGRLKQLLDRNPTMKIEIAGHTDDVGSDASNLDLSKRRAVAVQNYLVQQGVSPTRLTAKGFGETKKLVPNDSDAHRQTNRRVEFTILQK